MFPSHEIYDKAHYMKGIVEFGKVTTVDPKGTYCTITFPDRNYQSGPLKWVHRSCLGAQTYDMPTIGDTAVVLHSGIARERGVILGFVYTNGNPPPWTQQNSQPGQTPPPEATGQQGTWRGILFSDNSYIVYDQGGSNYILNLQGKITLSTVGDVKYTIGGKWTVGVTGAIAITSQSSIGITSQANCTINGVVISSSGNVTIPGTLTVGGVANLNGGGTASPHLTNSDGSGGGA